VEEKVLTIDVTTAEPVVISNLPAAVPAPAVVKKKLGRPKKENKVSSPLIESWFKYLKKVSKIESEQTMRTYHNAISQLFLFFKSQAKDIFKLTDDDISLWLEHLKEEKKAPSTVQLYLIAARLFFSFLCSKKFINQNPCLVGNITIKAGVTPDSREEHKRSDLSLAQVQAMLAAMPAETEMELRNRAIVALMVTSGLRCCEVSEAQCGDMTSSGEYTYLKLRGKGHNEKRAQVKVDPHAEKMIRQYWAVRFSGKYPKGQDFMFVSTSRNHDFVTTKRKEIKKIADTSDMLSTRTIRTICKKAMDKIGIGDAQHVAHSLRHTAATLALDAGEALPNVQMMMRHKNLETTMIYQHSFDRKKNNAEITIGKKIFGETK